MSDDYDHELWESEHRLRGLLWHAIYRNHEHSPKFCSPCEAIDKELDKYAQGRPTKTREEQ